MYTVVGLLAVHQMSYDKQGRSEDGREAGGMYTIVDWVDFLGKN